MIPADVYRSFQERGHAWADANYRWQQLDDQTKSILAAITLEAKGVDGVNSMAEAKEIALSASTYRDHLKDVAEAKRAALRAKVDYDAVQALFQAQRTVEASHRAAGAAA